MAEELQSGSQIGAWSIVRKIASGGMGSVYEAENTLSGTRRALKVVRPDLVAEPDVRARFLREVALASRIKHPNVVESLDPFVVGETVVLPMELLVGETLASRLSRGPLGYVEAVDLITALVGAVSTFHAAGVIHRDLKPANVFLARQPDGSIVPKVLDLGAAREVDGVRHTITGHAIGSPSFMAPEQARGERDLDRRVDVYALGVLLYCITTARRPFESDDQGSAIAKIVQGAPIVRPSRHREGYPSRLEQIVLTALAHRREDRFLSADALANALRAAVAQGLTLSLRAADDDETTRRGARADTSRQSATPTIVEASSWQPAMPPATSTDTGSVVTGEAPVIPQHRVGLALGVIAVLGLVAVAVTAIAMSSSGTAEAPVVADPSAPSITAAPITTAAGDPAATTTSAIGDAPATGSPTIGSTTTGSPTIGSTTTGSPTTGSTTTGSTSTRTPTAVVSPTSAPTTTATTTTAPPITAASPTTASPATAPAHPPPTTSAASATPATDRATAPHRPPHRPPHGAPHAPVGTPPTKQAPAAPSGLWLDSEDACRAGTGAPCD